MTFACTGVDMGVCMHMFLVNPLAISNNSTIVTALLTQFSMNVTLIRWLIKIDIHIPPSNLILGEKNVWSATVNVPMNTEILYRYFISANDPTTEEVHVRKWETHIEPRKLPPISLVEQPEHMGCYDTFGVVNGVTKVDRGWLTTETVIQFVFYKNPFSLKDRVKSRRIYVKVRILQTLFCIHCNKSHYSRLLQ